MSDRSLMRWQAAGLIDEATAARIRAWEATHNRPVVLWAVIGIAALSIGLGIISIIAANWDAIPGMVRLAIHSALLLAATVAIATKLRKLAARQPWFQEGALFVFGILGMTFIAHVGQVYQTTSPLWQPLALWLLLFGPLLLAEGLGWLTALTLMATLVIAIWNRIYASDAGSTKAALSIIRWTVEAGLPVLVGAGAAWMRRLSSREQFWCYLEQLGLVYAVGGASLIAAVASYKDLPADPAAHETLVGFATFAAIGIVAAAITWGGRPGPSGRATAGILAGAGLTILLAWPLSGMDVTAGLLFMALWSGIAAASLVGGWRGVFQLAVAVVAARLIILSFELAGDLLTSGFGLIVSGLLILAVAWLAVRVSRRFAPPKEAA